MSWGRAFEHIQQVSKIVPHIKMKGNSEPPDVVQIGSTWVAYLAGHDLILPFEDRDPKYGSIAFRDITSHKRISIRFNRRCSAFILLEIMAAMVR